MVHCRFLIIRIRNYSSQSITFNPDGKGIGAVEEVAPDTNKGIPLMKHRIILSLILAMVIGATMPAFAQKKDPNPKKMENTQARQEEPEIRTFVTPQICDMQMLSKSRETYGPYYFNLSTNADNVTNGEWKNAEGRALYRACQEADADLIIGTMYDSYIYEKDQKVLVVEVSGYPAKFVNWRAANKAEVDMIGIIYPDARTSVSVTTGKEK